MRLFAGKPSLSRILNQSGYIDILWQTKRYAGVRFERQSALPARDGWTERMGKGQNKEIFKGDAAATWTCPSSRSQSENPFSG